MYVKSIIIYIIFINSIQTQGQTWQISNQCKEGQSYIDNSCRNCTVGKYSTNNIRSTCEYCTAGKFNDIEGASVCKTCMAGYYSVSGSETCSRCNFGQFQPSTSSSSCLQCAPGKFTAEMQSVSCKECPKGYYQTTSGSNTCSVCPEGFTQTSLGSEFCTECRIGTFWVGHSTCQNCPHGYYQQESARSNCLRCPSGYSNDYEQSSFCRKCPQKPEDGKICIGWGIQNNASFWTECSIGNYSNDLVCLECPVGYRSARHRTSRGFDSCVQCDIGKGPAIELSSNSEFISVCERCTPGRYEKNRMCVDCVAGKYGLYYNATSCIDCESGLYKNSSGIRECSSCPAGWSSNGTTGSINCTECSLGKMSHIRQSICTDSCPNISFVTTSPKICSTCQPGQYYKNNTCVACPAGYFKTDSPKCQQCPTGYVNNSDATVCFLCDEGSVPQNSSSCVGCPSGFFASKYVEDGVSGCILCQVGRYQSETNTMRCSMCSIGQYQDEFGSIQCKECLNGTFSATEGASVCVDCPLGTISGNGSSSCQQCSSGKGIVYGICGYGKECKECPQGTEDVMGVCQPCQVGKSRYGHCSICGINNLKCSWCPSGRYQDELGKKSCKSCPSSTGIGSEKCCTTFECATCDKGKFFSEFKQSCVLCPIGQFGYGGSSICEKCPTGYHSVENRIECLECPSGFVVSDTSCSACQKGHYQHDNICKACPRGYYQNKTGVTNCKSCETFEMTTSTGSIEKSSCKECSSQYVIVVKGSCDVCPFGHYYDETYGTHTIDNCKICPSGWETSSTKTCKKCLKNYYSENTGQCKICPQGFSTENEGSSICSHCQGTECSGSCPYGQYKEIGSNCKKCPSGYVSLGGYQRTCSMCSVGRYQHNIGQQICIECPPGKYSEKGGNDICHSCPTGQYQHLSQQGGCLDCAIGQYTQTVGQTECQTCIQGKYTNTIRTNSSNFCIDCPKGWLGIVDGTCAQCPEGTWQNETGKIVCNICNTTGLPLSPPQSISSEQCFDGSGLVTYVFDMDDDSKEAQTYETGCEIRPNMVLYCPSCTCNNDARNGYWDGPVCDECRRGFAGGRVGKCLIKCPGYDGIHDSTMCGGLGKCWYGKYGSGECLCGGKNMLDVSSQNIVVDVKTCPVGRKCPGYGPDIMKTTQYKPFYYLLEYREYSVFVLQLNQYTPRRGHMWFQRYSPQNIYENVCSSCVGKYDSTEYTRVGYFNSKDEYKMFDIDLQVKNGFHGENCQYECATCLNNGRCLNTPHPFYYSYEYESVRPELYHPVFIPKTQCICSASIFDSDAMCCPYGFEPYVYFGKRNVVPYFEFSALPLITEVNDNVREYWLDDDLWLQNKYPKYKEPYDGQMFVSNINKKYQNGDNLGIISVDYKKFGPYNKHTFYGTEKELCRACPGLFGKGVVSRSTKITTEEEAEQYWWDSSAAGRKCNNLGVCDFYGQRNEKNVLFMGEYKKTSSNVKYKIHRNFSTCNRQVYKLKSNFTLNNCIEYANTENAKSFAYSTNFIFSDKTRVDLTNAFTIKPEESGQQKGSYGYVEKNNKYYSLTSKDGETWPTPDSNGDMIFHPWSEGECLLFDTLCTETEIINNARFNLYRLDRTGQGSDRLQTSTFNRLDTCFTYDDGTFKTKIGNFVTQSYKNGQDPFLGENCPKGHFCTQTGTGDDIVGYKEACPPGYFQPFFGITRENSNVQCSIETEKKDSCQENLSTKKPNDYVDKRCQRCKRNEYSPEGASECYACPAGRVKKISGNVQLNSLQIHNIPKDSTSGQPWYYITDETGIESSDCALVPNGIIHVPSADKYMSNDNLQFISVISCPFGYSSRPGTYVIQGHEQVTNALSSQASVIKEPFGSFDSQFGTQLQKDLVAEYCFHCPGSSMTGPGTMSCTTCFGDQLNDAMKNIIKKLTEKSYIPLNNFGIPNSNENFTPTGTLRYCSEFTEQYMVISCNWGYANPNLQPTCIEYGNTLSSPWNSYAVQACEIGKKLRRLPTSYETDIGVWKSWGTTTVYLNNCEQFIWDFGPRMNGATGETSSCLAGLNGLNCNNYGNYWQQLSCIMGQDIRNAQDIYKNIQIEELVSGTKYLTGGSESIEVMVLQDSTIADAMLYCNVALPNWEFIQKNQNGRRFKCVLGGGTEETWNNLGEIYTQGVRKISGSFGWTSEYPLCNTCISGEYRDTLSRKCVECPAGFQSADIKGDMIGESIYCTKCQIGRFSNIKALICSECSAGMYQDEEQKSYCLSCPRGYYSQSNPIKCEECPGGKYNDKEGSVAGTTPPPCVKCPSGRISLTTAASSISSCQSCESGKVPNYEATPPKCESCKIGKFINQNIECEDCPEGYSQHIGGLVFCNKCGRGKYATGTGSFTCKSCPIGWQSEYNGELVVEQVLHNKCIKCLPGYQCVIEGRKRFGSDNAKCQPGSSSSVKVIRGNFAYYEQKEFHGECEPCDKGMFSAKVGAENCILCPDGWTTFDFTGSDYCKVCDTGWSPLGPSGECALCKAGNQYNSYYRTCTICPVGWEGKGEGKDAWCYPCKKQEYSDVTGITDCKWCPKGYDTRDETGSVSCKSCKPGKYRTSARANDWWSCPSGWYAQGYGNTHCNLCPLGTWTRDQRGWDKCQYTIVIGNSRVKYYP